MKGQEPPCNNTMDTTDRYREYVQTLMRDRASRMWDDRITAETIFDTNSDRY